MSIISLDIGNDTINGGKLSNNKITNLSGLSDRLIKNNILFEENRYFDIEAYNKRILKNANYKNNIIKDLVENENKFWNKYSNIQIFGMIIDYLNSIWNTEKNKDLIYHIALPNYLYLNKLYLFETALKMTDFNYKFVNQNIGIMLDYGVYKNTREEFKDKPQTILFLNSGDYVTSLFLVLFEHNNFTILNNLDDITIGGESINNAIYNLIIDKINKNKQFSNKINNNFLNNTNQGKKLKYKIYNEIIKNKHKLNFSKTINIFVENILNDLDLDINLSVDEIEDSNYLQNILKKHENIITSITKEIDFDINNIDYLEVLGGNTRFTPLKNILKKKFNQKIKTTLNTEETICRGTLLYALKKNNSKKSNSGRFISNNKLDDISINLINYDIYTLVINSKNKYTILNKYDLIPKVFKTKIKEEKNTKNHIIKIFKNNDLLEMYKINNSKTNLNLSIEINIEYKLKIKITLNNDSNDIILNENFNILINKYKNINLKIIEKYKNMNKELQDIDDSYTKYINLLNILDEYLIKVNTFNANFLSLEQITIINDIQILVNKEITKKILLDYSENIKKYDEKKNLIISIYETVKKQDEIYKEIESKISNFFPIIENSRKYLVENELNDIDKFVKTIKQLKDYLKEIKKNMNTVDESTKIIVLSLIDKTKELLNK